MISNAIVVMRMTRAKTAAVDARQLVQEVADTGLRGDDLGEQRGKKAGRCLDTHGRHDRRRGGRQHHLPDNLALACAERPGDFDVAVLDLLDASDGIQDKQKVAEQEDDEDLVSEAEA